MRRYFLLLTVASLAAIAADNPMAWRKKPIADWNEEDAKQILRDSPWVKITHLEKLPDLPQSARAQEARERAHTKQDAGSVLVRWESAVPVHAAEVRLGDMSGPRWQTQYYAIAVFDVPVPPHWRSQELKGIAFLKRYQKKDIKPSRVEVLLHENNAVDVVYFFSRSQELTKKDVTVVFQAQVGRVVVSQPFTIDKMQFQGNLEF